MAAIETEKFQNMVSSIGADTLQAIATAGPEMQVQVHNQLKRLITPISRGGVCVGGGGDGGQRGQSPSSLPPTILFPALAVFALLNISWLMT